MAADSALAVVGWSTVSPIGTGREEFSRAVLDGRCARRAREAHAERAPLAAACTIPDFDVTRHLGARGTRTLDRTSALAVVSTGLALRDAGFDAAHDGERLGVVVGTSNGSLRATFDYTSDTLTGGKPYMVSPELFHTTVMNCAAGQCAIWHKLRALNTTLSGGRMAGLLGLRYARRVLLSGYAEGLLFTSVDEFSEPFAWGAHHTFLSQPECDALLGEGSVTLALMRREPALAQHRRVHAELLACEVGLFDAGGAGREAQARGLAQCVRRALEAAGLGPRDVWALSRRESGVPELDRLETRALCLALEGARPAWGLAVARQVGECFSAAGAFQAAALMALFEAHPDEPRRIGLVTSVAHGGAAGCAVLRGV